MLTTLYV